VALNRNRSLGAQLILNKYRSSNSDTNILKSQIPKP